MTATLGSPSPVRTPVRIRRAPSLEPPPDDIRRADDHPLCAGQLALFTTVHRASAPGAGHRGGPNAMAGAHSVTAATNAASGAAAAIGAQISPARIAAGRFVAACVEVLNGFRPAAHLRVLTSPVGYATAMTQLTRRAQRVRMPSTGREHRADIRARASLRRVHVFEQRAGQAEAVAVLITGDVSWAVALSFEYRGGSWLCSRLEVI
ncbi:MAG: hypothetical protein QOE03_1894 [Micromonosporaceae bacterium]|nr:hypothetical protein [Micromonosporaceae bacterium]